MNLYLTETTILNHKIRSICNHVLHHVHALIALGILLHAYACLLENGFPFFFSRKSSIKIVLLKK